MRKTRLPIIACFVLIALYAGLFSWLGIARYQSTFSYDWRDEAVDNQILYNSSQGDLMLSTIKGEQRHHRHFRPMFLPAAVPYIFYPDARMWYATAALISALGALAAFRIGERLFGHPNAGLLASAAWLAWPALRDVTLSNLDPESFVATIWLFAAAAYLDKKFWTFLAFAVLALCCKETQAPVLAGFGLVMLAQRARPRFWATSLILGFAWFFLAIKVIIPSYFPAFPTVYNRFIGVDGTNFPSGFFAVLAAQPLETLRHVFSREHVSLLIGIIRPLGYLCVFAPLQLIAPGAVILQGLLLKDPLPVRQAHTLSALLPFVFWATLAGVSRLAEWLAKFDFVGARRKRAAQYTLLAAVAATSLLMTFSPGPFGRYQNYGKNPLGDNQASNYFDPAFRTPTPARQRVYDAVRKIPPDAVVTANSRLLLLLSSRRTLHEFGAQRGVSDFSTVDFVVLWYPRAECPTCTFNELNPESLALAAELVESGRFGVAVDDPAFAVLVSKSLLPHGFPPNPDLAAPYIARVKKISGRLAAGEGLPSDNR